MVIKVDKSEEFKKSGKKLISEYEGEKWLEEIKRLSKPRSATLSGMTLNKVILAIT